MLPPRSKFPGCNCYRLCVECQDLDEEYERVMLLGSPVDDMTVEAEFRPFPPRGWLQSSPFEILAPPALAELEAQR